MPSSDRSIAILTGMIIAALYVILLVGFSQESYMRRDAARRGDSGRAVAALDDVSKRVCRAEPPICSTLFAEAGEQQNCVTSIDVMRRLLSEPMVPVTLEGIRRAMQEEP